jgi:hypothetical protein
MLSEVNNTRVVRVLALLASLAACALFYLPTIGGGFLSDDYSVLGALDAWAGEHRLIAALLAKFGEGLDSPSHYYRPLAMLSFGVNYALSGVSPLSWRLTNLAVHLCSTALVFAIATRLGEPARARPPIVAPTLAAVVFAAFPTNVEAVAWVSGRYDLLALAFMLATVACFQRSQRWNDGWGIAALAAAVCAFSSKESAALLPVLVLVVAIGRRWPAGAGKALVVGVRDAAPWLALGVAYFVLRAAIFGTPFRVFPGPSPLEALLSGDWVKPLASGNAWLEAAMPSPLPRTAFLAAIAVLVAMGALASLRSLPIRGAWLAIAVATTLSIVLLLPHVANLLPSGEHARLLYTTSALLALLVALPWRAWTYRNGSRIWRGSMIVATAALVASEAALLRAAIAPWVEAGNEATMLIAALPRVAQTIPTSGYGLVLVPAYLSNVPFGHNAQGGLITSPVQREPLSQRLVVQTPLDLPPWPGHMARGLVDALRRYPLTDVWTAVEQGRAVGGVAPTHYFCWAAGARQLVPLSWSAELAARDWLAAWRSALAASPCDASARELATL